LIVEDDMVFSYLLQEHLHSMGYNVIETTSYAEQAISKTADIKPDLILMDIKLKGEMDGIDAMKKIREFSNVPVIYISGNSDKMHKQKAEQIGYFDFLIKPISRNMLKTSLLRLENHLDS